MSTYNPGGLPETAIENQSIFSAEFNHVPIFLTCRTCCNDYCSTWNFCTAKINGKKLCDIAIFITVDDIAIHSAMLGGPDITSSILENIGTIFQT